VPRLNIGGFREDSIGFNNARGLNRLFFDQLGQFHSGANNRGFQSWNAKNAIFA
jgi:hypothetical protein